MKYILTLAIGLFATFGVVEASKNLINGVEIAKVGVGSEAIFVSKIVDGTTTCYVTKHGKFGAHAISCVK